MLELAARLLDPTALALVLGGTVATAAMRGTKQEVARAVAALKPLFRARPAAEALTAQRAVRPLGRIVDFKGIACPHPVQSNSTFLARPAIHLAHEPKADIVAASPAKNQHSRDEG